MKTFEVFVLKKASNVTVFGPHYRLVIVLLTKLMFDLHLSLRSPLTDGRKTRQTRRSNAKTKFLVFAALKRKKKLETKNVQDLVGKR